MMPIRSLGLHPLGSRTTSSVSAVCHPSLASVPDFPKNRVNSSGIIFRLYGVILVFGGWAGLVTFREHIVWIALQTYHSQNSISP